jgi:predicted RNase H-like HicB family nuclease
MKARYPVDRKRRVAQNGGMVTFRIETDGEEYRAWSPELPGVHTHGATRAVALENLKDAVRLYLDDVMEESLMPGYRPARKRKTSAA